MSSASSSELNPSKGAPGRTALVLLGVFVVAVGALLAFLVMRGGEPKVHAFVIEKGTRAILDAGGTPPNAPPTTLDVDLGDVLEVTNNDVVAHTYAFLVLRPGETGRYEFKNRGTFVGDCTASGQGQMTITVT